MYKLLVTVNERLDILTSLPPTNILEICATLFLTSVRKQAFLSFSTAHRDCERGIGHVHGNLLPYQYSAAWVMNKLFKVQKHRKNSSIPGTYDPTPLHLRKVNVTALDMTVLYTI